MKKAACALFWFLLIFSFCFIGLGFTQTMSEQERAAQLEDKDKELMQRLEEEKEPAKIEEEKQPGPPAAEAVAEKALIQNISVSGVTAVSEKEIKAITLPFENKELEVKEMQKVADLITDYYRQKGFVTTRAYLPPQKLEKGVLEIKVQEGVMGAVEIKGNRYFSNKLLLSKITLKKGSLFNYDILRKDIADINKSPDRSSRAVLMAGKEPGQTDMLLEVNDRLPIHAGFSLDNFGSRYIEGYRYTVKVSDNNLLGFDDSLAFQYMLAQRGRYFLKNVRYLLPFDPGWQIGLSSSLSRVKLGEELEDSDVRGKSHLYGIFLIKNFIQDENLYINFNAGFDYKNITNYQNQAVSFEDRKKKKKIGLDMDLSDNFGRTIFASEFDFGIPSIMGGLKKASSTTTSSRSGSGGEFVKTSIDLIRLQKIPLSSNLLWKNQLQISPYILTSAEEFQIGGITNARGYPSAEAVGDNGFASAWELYFPAYFVSKEIKAPFSRASFYDAFRGVIFYELATARLRRPAAGEDKNKTLKSAGFGMRFNLPENFSLRLDLGWPLDNTPSDSDQLHTWLQISKDF